MSRKEEMAKWLAEDPSTREKDLFSAEQLREEGFSAKALKAGGLSAEHLHDGWYSARAAIDAGYLPMELVEAGYSSDQVIKAKEHRDAAIAPAGWKQVSECLPPLEELVWLHEDGVTFIGGRFYNDVDGWLWSRAGSTVECIDGHWDCSDLYVDDIKPELWAHLIEQPMKAAK